MTIGTTRWACALALAAGGAAAQSDGLRGEMRQATPHLGEMLVTMEMPAEAEIDAGEGVPEDAVVEVLRFEPWQMLDEMFLRDDVVFLMRHGPIEGPEPAGEDASPADCANQSIMGPEGLRQMREMGTLMAANDVLPSRIAVSEWCPSQQTLDALLAGFDAVDPALSGRIAVVTDQDLNLLPEPGEAGDVDGLRESVTSWDGPEEGEAPGPLLLITHFTNIEALTTFTVYEGEMLVVDPDRDNRVLGYLRLASAGPDAARFDVPGQRALDAAAAAGQ